jgi:starch synthase
MAAFMRILMAASEMAPFARTGGLGDVLAELPCALQKRGHEVSTVIPYYAGAHFEKEPVPTGLELDIPLGAHTLRATVFETESSRGTQVFLIENAEMFARKGLYGEPGVDYMDNAARFIFFSKACVELACRLDPQPDILHVHDWQTALAAVLRDAWNLPFKTVLTVHNAAFQGLFHSGEFGLTNLPAEFYSSKRLEYYGSINLLKAGILAADEITTVSETYARELVTPEGGAGLHQIFQSRQVHPILNGADYEIWNPVNDRLIPRRFDAKSLAGKSFCRTRLLSRLGLAPKPSGPVYGMLTRLTEQKGFDILLPVLDRLLADDVRLVILGEGDPAYAAALSVATRQHASKLAFVENYDEPLAHAMIAGCDILLSPSHYEPCGPSRSDAPWADCTSWFGISIPARVKDGDSFSTATPPMRCGTPSAAPARHTRRRINGPSS